VDIRVVVDGLNRFESPKGSGNYVPFSALQDIRTALGDDAVVICSEDEVPPVHLRGGCLSSGINHNKFAVFSELCDGSHDVVYQSSSNFSAQQNSAHQNAVILRDDPLLYGAYLQYWNDEAAKLPIPNYDRGLSSRAFFFPRQRTGVSVREPDTDTVNTILDNVSCASGTRVRVAMAYWNDSRDYLVDKLREMRDAGCDVRVISNVEITSDGVKAKLASAFSTGELRLLPRVHDKYFFIDGTYLGTQRKLVWTGSHNWDFGALRTNEEAILRVEDPEVFAAFDANWDRVWATGDP
jgi:phosphatidylserine/phosphatidylglycerophosphate/cardiolipin synthase-like enzyme